jgi:hypothetical protein
VRNNYFENIKTSTDDSQNRHHRLNAFDDRSITTAKTIVNIIMATTINYDNQAS